MFFACWFCLLSSINIPLRWKAAQAMQFAQASSRPTKARDPTKDNGKFARGKNNNDKDGDDDNDDDIHVDDDDDEDDDDDDDDTV